MKPLNWTGDSKWQEKAIGRIEFGAAAGNGNVGATSVTDITTECLTSGSFIEVYDGCTVRREKISNETFNVSGMSLNQLFGIGNTNAFFNNISFLGGTNHSTETNYFYTGSDLLNGISFDGTFDATAMLRN